MPDFPWESLNLFLKELESWRCLQRRKKGLIDNDLHNFVYFHNSIENFFKIVLVFFYIVLSSH